MSFLCHNARAWQTDRILIIDRVCILSWSWDTCKLSTRRISRYCSRQNYILCLFMVRPLLGERQCEIGCILANLATQQALWILWWVTTHQRKISELFAAADQSLFERVLRNELHVHDVLQPLLPEKKMISNHHVRARQHDRQLIRKSAHINDSVYRQNALQRLLLTVTVTFVSFVTLFTVYFSSMYSSCDLSTGIFYTNIWIWIR